jgi:hypothetical protein
MRPSWPRVKSAFEAVSYILKPMAPDGIELYFTISYDTYRRHNTSELVDFLEKKPLSGDTDIAYRLGLQLADYKVKLSAAPIGGGKKGKKERGPRGLSVYVLTDGNWKAGSDPTAKIKEFATYLVESDRNQGHGAAAAQVAIQFITFGRDEAALKRIEEVANTDFGM